MKLRIATTVTASGIILALGVLITLATSFKTLRELMVNGPIYQQIVDSKDLIADILPPPLYLVEAYSLATEAGMHAESVTGNIARLEKLKADYLERGKYWETSTLPDAMKKKLHDDVIVKGDLFWQEMQDRVIPALRANKPEGLEAVLDELRDRFHDHEKAVNELVEMGTAYGKSLEVAAAERSALLQTISMTLGGVLVLLCVASILFIRTRALRPLGAITAAMSQMARGDLQKAPPYLTRSDEIGDIAKALGVFRDAGLEKRRLEAEAERAQVAAEEQRRIRETERAIEAEALRAVVERLGAGLHRLADCNMRMTIDMPFDERFEVLRADFNNSIATFQETLEQVLGETSHLQTNSREMRDAADSLAKRTEQQAAALEETAAALEEVSSTVQNSASRTRETRNLVKEARQCATASTDVVQNAIAAMQRIEGASGEIGSIISVIDEIAFQTNLLALNAGVEAARAGEAGKGFAVVAQEVRELAQRSASAARQIKTLIDRSNSEVSTGVQLVGATGSVLEQIGGFVSQIDENIDAISSTAEEQAAGLKQISISVNTLDQMTQQNAAMVEETNAISQTIADGAVSLASLVNRFQLADKPRQRTINHAA